LLAAGALLAACAPRASAPPAATPNVLLAEAVPAPSAASSSGLEALQDRDAHEMARMGGWVAIGFGALAGTIAIATSVQMLHDKSVRDADCDAAKVCSSAGLSANTDIASASGWNIGAWAATAVSLGVGAFFVITNPGETEPRTQVGIAPTGSGGAITVRSAF
jgi:hypothetical protein